MAIKNNLTIRLGRGGNNLNYAKAYYKTSCAAYENLKSDEDKETLAFPLLFLMHHSIELYLKSILWLEPQIRNYRLSSNISQHNLEILHNELEKIICLDERFCNDEKKYIKKYISENSGLSNDGTNYRFSRSILYEHTLEIPKNQKKYLKIKEKFEEKSKSTTILLIFNPLKKEWEVFKNSRKSCIKEIRIDAYSELIDELEKISSETKKHDKNHLDFILRKYELNSTESFPVWRNIRINQLFILYERAVGILEKWYWLSANLEDEYLYNEYTDNLSPNQIEFIAKKFQGFINLESKNRINDELKKLGVDISNSEFKKAIDIISKNRILSPHIGIFHPFMKLSNESINRFLELAHHQLSLMPKTTTNEILSVSDLSGLMEYSLWESSFLAEIKKKFTIDEIIDLITLYQLGINIHYTCHYESLFESIKKHFSVEEHDNIINHNLHKTNLIDSTLKGLEKIGFICLLEG